MDDLSLMSAQADNIMHVWAENMLPAPILDCHLLQVSQRSGNRKWSSNANQL